MMDSNSLINNMTAGLGHTSMANSLASSLANTNSMVSGFTNTSMASLGSTNSMGSTFPQFGLSRKSTSELSPGSRKATTAGLPSAAGQSLQPPPPQQGQQAFNIQPAKPRKQGFFGEEEDSETSMYFPGSSNLFRPDKDMLNQSQSPSQPAGFGNNFYTQGGLNSFSHPQQRGPISGPQFQRSGIPQSSPNRGVISAIGQHRMINTSQANQAAMSGLQKRPIGSGLPNSTAGPITSFGFPSRSEGGQPNFDLSDFPSLGNRVTPSSSLSARNYVGMVNKNPVQDQTPEFQIQQEDFPALPGAQSTLSMFVSDPPTSTNKDPLKQKPMNLLSGPSYEQALNNDEKPGNDKLGTSVRKGIQVHADGRITNIPPKMVPDQFGIVGLLSVIRSVETDPSLEPFTSGLDLTTLGLNINSPDNLYSTFQSPWVGLQCRPQDIDFHVPAEYLTNIYVRDKLAPIKLNRYGEDLLFYLFYMNGGDVLQLAAAAELYNRDWRYHKEERVWITRAPGVEPVLKTNTYEKGTYYFFDVANWRKIGKDFYLEYDKLEDRPSLPTSLYHNPNQPIAAH